MANCRVKTGRFGSICLLLALWVIVLTQLVNSYDNCRTVRPIQGYCLTEEYSYQIIHGISLGTCIVHCEGSAKCSSISYQSEPNVCRLNNVTRNLSFSDFIQDEMCTYLENVLRPSSCFTHVCKSCACWCDRVQEDGDCEVCGSKALGMENGDIKDSQISGSKSTVTYEPVYGRLENKTGWYVNTASTQYIQVSFLPAKVTLTHIASQGHYYFQCWVTKYKVQYTTHENMTDWQEYGTDNKSPLIFQGNNNRGTIIKNELPRPLIGVTAVRIQAHRWSSCIGMRIELYGC